MWTDTRTEAVLRRLFWPLTKLADLLTWLAAWFRSVVPNKDEPIRPTQAVLCGLIYLALLLLALRLLR